MNRSTVTIFILGVLTASLLLGESRARGQTPSAENPTFEVASVRPNKSADGRVMIGIQPGGRFTATNVPLRILIRQAYDVQEFQIVGGPGWIGSDRFDIVAKAPDGEPTPDMADRMRLMLRSLLAERFNLAAHDETRDMPIYALVVDRRDGRLGPNLTPSAVDCAGARGRRSTPPALPQPGQRPDCGLMIGIGRMNAGGMPIGELARTLSPQVGRIVIDRTGLTGGYDFELTYAPEQRGGAGLPPLLNGAPVPANPDAPSIFTALQEQLGLKLDSDRGSVEVLVIDRVEQPTPD